MPAEALLGGCRPAARGGRLTGGQRRLGPGQLRFREIVIEPLPPERRHGLVQRASRVAGQAGRHQRAGLVHRQNRHDAGRAQPVAAGGRVEEPQRSGNVAGQQIAVAQVVQRLGPEPVVTAGRRDPLAAGRVGARPPDIPGVEVDDAAIEQRRRQVRGLRGIPLKQGHGLVKCRQSVAVPSRPHEDEPSLETQDAPVVRRDHVLGPVHQTQPVVGAALLGLPLCQDSQHPGGQGTVRLGHLPRIGLLPFGPAQLPQPRADIASADRRPAAVALPQAALTSRAG